ncbi:MAG: DUF4920 domain-containing protein [Planctomycetes bacterium]|nr:DUF4920 domain-containing protein [Planctomycetota bacterium]
MPTGDLARRSSIALALGAALVAVAWGARGQDAQPAPTTRPTSRPAARAPELPPLGAPAGAFGAGVTLPDATPLERVVAEPGALQGRPVRVDGRIKDVCRKKGCWMVLTDGEREVRVRFKDYGFFVPRDASGRAVIVQGEVLAEEISEEVARHYAEEGGDPDRAAEIHGPQKVVSVIATGVEVLGRDAPPLVAAGTPEVTAALARRLGQAQRVAPGGAPVASLDEAFRALRAAPGGRTAELGLAAELPDWFAFSVEGPGEPFVRGWAVRRATGEVVRFGAGAR